MIYILLIFSWSFLNFLNVNLSSCMGIEAICSLGFSLMFVSGVLWIVVVKIFKKSINDYLLFLFVSVLWFFFYGVFVDFLGRFNNTGFKSSYIYLIFSILSIVLSLKFSSNLFLQKGAKIFIITIFLVSSLDFALNFRKILVDGVDYSYDIHNIKPNKFQRKPNVYYLLVDAYPRRDSLKELCGFDNSDFIFRLEELGFAVSSGSRSNYHFTIGSVASTMNMNYHRDISNVRSSLSKVYGGCSAVWKKFKIENYKIINVPAHWVEGSNGRNADLTIKNNFLYVFTSFFSGSILRVFDVCHSYVQPAMVKGIVDNSELDPKFVFVHFAQVHDAAYDETGIFRPFFRFIGANDLTPKRGVTTIIVFNEPLLELAKYIRDKDPGAIIIIQSDHGYNSVFCKDINIEKEDSNLLDQKKLEFRCNFYCFSAIYLPEYEGFRHREAKEYFEGDFSLVNTFRYIFAYLCNEEPELLKDEQHYLIPEGVNGYRELDISRYVN